MGRVTINGTQAQFSCKYSIAVEQWDTKANKVKGKSKEARDINLRLTTSGHKLSNITNEFPTARHT